MKCLMTMLAMPLICALAYFAFGSTASHAEGSAEIKAATKAAEDAEDKLLVATAKTMDLIRSKQITIIVEEGDTIGRVLEKACEVANQEVGMQGFGVADFLYEEVGLDGEYSGRLVDLLNEFSGNSGLAWAPSGSKLLVAESWENLAAEQITRAYDTGAIQEALNNRQTALVKKKKTADATPDSEEKEAEEESIMAEEYLMNVIYNALFVDREEDSDKGAVFGGIYTLTAYPHDHVKLERLLAKLRKALNITE